LYNLLREAFLSPGVERFTGPETSGFIPVSDHGCGDLCSVLRGGKGEGLVGCVLSFSKVCNFLILWGPLS
jgi:hypothetical protein